MFAEKIDHYPPSATALQDIPELGRIKAAAERIAKVRSDIECFHGRFYGESGCADGGNPERASGYRNDIASLFEQIEHLEMVASQLTAIG